MESSEDVEVVSRAIEKLLDEKRKREAAGDPFIEDDDDQLLLSRLFLELESPKQGRKAIGKIKEEEEESAASEGEGKKDLEVSIEEIAKDIKKVQRQNTITHVLLSTMIILTVAWQLSEFSMVFMMKERLCNPVRSIGGMFSGLFKGKLKDKLPGAKEHNNHDNGNESSTGAHLQVPELLREFGFNDDEE